MKSERINIQRKIGGPPSCCIPPFHKSLFFVFVGVGVITVQYVLRRMTTITFNPTGFARAIFDVFPPEELICMPDIRISSI